MNTNQITSVLQVISSIESYEIDKIPETIFKNQDITTINIGQYILPDYIIALKRMLKQLKVELSDNGIYIPLQYSFQNDFGNGTFNLQSELQNLFNLLNQKSQQGLNQSIPYLNRLIYFQITNGFWDRSKIKIHKVDEIKITELNEKLKTISKQLSVNQDNFKIQIDNLDLEKKKIVDFLTQRQQELQQISSNLQTSNTNQINQLLTTSTAKNGKIDALLSQQNQNFDAQKKKAETEDKYFVKQKETFGTLEINLNEKVRILETQITNFEKKDYLCRFGAGF